MGAFIHFIKGLLNFVPEQRWTPAQALFHPFITGEPFNSDWYPPDRKDGNDFDKLFCSSSSFYLAIAFGKISETLQKTAQPIRPDIYLYLQNNVSFIWIFRLNHDEI